MTGPNLLISLWTDAHEVSNEVFALIFAVVGWCLALIHVLAVPSVCPERVAVRADAAERALHIVAPEGALMGQLLALVNVFARLGVRQQFINKIFGKNKQLEHKVLNSLYYSINELLYLSE